MNPTAPPAQVVRQRIEAFGEQSRLRAGSLVITVFGDAIVPRGGRLWVGSLIRLLAPLGINERLTRTTVFRLAKDEWLRIEAHGRRADYLLTPAGQRRFEEAARAIYAVQPRAWDGRWRLMLLVGDMPARVLATSGRIASCTPAPIWRKPCTPWPPRAWRMRRAC